MSSGGDASSSGNDWCTIESDPGVFTALVEELGVRGVEFQELWSLDDSSLIDLVTSCGGHVYGLIFLFQWKQEQQTTSVAAAAATNASSSSRSKPLSESDIPDHLFFAHQVTTNACATQAILSVLFNATELSEQQKGSTLNEFQSFTQDFPPSLKGVAISSSEEIKKVHNSFSRPDAAFLNDGKIHLPTPGEESEAFHFVAYVPFSNGTVYELDGLQKGPIVIGTSPSEAQAPPDDQLIPSWLIQARQAIQDRMALFTTQQDNSTEGATSAPAADSSSSEGGIKFNLMAVIQDKRISNAQDEMVLAQEQAKRMQWKLENERRRHNYVPLALQMLKELACLGLLNKLSQEAVERTMAKRQAKKKQ